MGKYKDKKGTTLMGDILRKAGSLGKVIGPEALKVVGTMTGMSSLTKLGNALDSDPNIDQATKKELMAVAEARIQRDIEEAKEISLRWNADTKSDSWLSRNVRPMVLGWLIFFMSIIIVTDSIDTVSFEVSDTYITLLQTLLVTVIVAYFGSRGMEKYKKISNGSKIS